MLSPQWFYEEFGFDESELKNGKKATDFFEISDNKFNTFTSRTRNRNYYAGRFDCLKNNELDFLLSQLKEGKNSLQLSDLCYNQFENLPAQEHQKKKLKIENSSQNEKISNILPQNETMKMGPKPQSEPQKPLNLDESKVDGGFEEPEEEKSDVQKKEKDFDKQLQKGLTFSHEKRAVKSIISQNKNAVFQVASQFNCLEMIGPSVTPSHGITNYIMDQTQGPECALCCRSALFYRNYLYEFGKGNRGQLKNQINLLDEVEKYVNNKKYKFWFIKNGYCLTDNAEKAKILGDVLRKKMMEKPDSYLLQKKMMEKPDSYDSKDSKSKSESKPKKADDKHLPENKTPKKEQAVKESHAEMIKKTNQESAQNVPGNKLENNSLSMTQPSNSKAQEKTNDKIEQKMAYSEEGNPSAKIEPTKKIDDIDPQSILSSIKVGIHWDTEVTPGNSKKFLNDHRVCQVFCSTLALTYDKQKSAHLKSTWDPFCRLILQGQYEATLAVAGILAFLRKERVKVYLTAVGGGVFGNSKEWIREAIQKSIDKYRDLPIDVSLVSLSSTPKEYEKIGSL